MKKLLLIFVLALFAQKTFAVAIERITSNSLRFYNYSNSNFDLNNMQITVNMTVLEVNNLNIKTGGPLLVAAGTKIEFDGLSIPSGPASIALWYPGTFPGSPNAGVIASYVQYGASGQAYETIADQAGLWTAGTFIAGVPPFIRDQNYVTWGVSNWSQGLSEIENHLPAISIYPNPFSEEVNLSNLGEGIEYAEIVDASGKLYFRAEGNRNEDLKISTLNLQKGVYLFRFQTETGQFLTYRLVKI